MASAQEIPELISESIDLSKQYLMQETVEPAKRLGKVAGFGFAASFVFGVAVLLGSVALNRWIIDLLPEGRAWSGLGYLVSAVVLAALAALVVYLGRRGYEDPGTIKEAFPALAELGEE